MKLMAGEESSTRKKVCPILKHLAFLATVLGITVFILTSIKPASNQTAKTIDPLQYAKENHVRKSLLAKEISPDHPSPHGHIWIDLNNNMTVIRRTAFFDVRKGFGPQIVLISLHHDSITIKQPPLYAKVVKKDGSALCLEVKVWEQVGWVRETIDPPEVYVTYLLRIFDPQLTEAPQYIQLSQFKDCNAKSLFPRMPVFFDQRPKENVFAVCTQKGLFGGVSPTDMINWVEINRAMGAAIITIQIQQTSLGDQLEKLLAPYIKEGFVELIDWKIEVGTRDYGMSASANECIYRNINRAQFVTITDSDELLVPQKHNTWSEMVAYLRNFIDVDQYASFTFRNTYWYYNGEPLTEPPCPGKQVPRYFNWTLRVAHPHFGYPKVMANLDHTISGFCHSIWRWKYGKRKEYYISPSIGLSHHYRIPSKGKGNKKSDVMKRYIDTVMPRVKSKLCH